ncbi:hypothetical protein GCM10028807_47110 [Spirosoma daeguense]
MKYVVFLFAPLLLSCSFGAYSPANQNVPLFRQRGDARLELSSSYLQGALAVSQHVGVLANIQYASGTEFMKATGTTRHRRMEVGAGYFRSASSDPNLIYELYAGVGGGWVYWKNYKIGTYDPSTGISSLDDAPFTVQNTNVFIQPAIGYRQPKASFALSAKLNGVGYGTLLPHTSAAATSVESSMLDMFDNLGSKINVWVEPALTTSFGGYRFRSTVQVFTAFPLNNSKYEWRSLSTQLISFGSVWAGIFGLIALNQPEPTHEQTIRTCRVSVGLWLQWSGAGYWPAFG